MKLYFISISNANVLHQTLLQEYLNIIIINLKVSQQTYNML